MPLDDGAVFAGYTILRVLGTGGMGEVYLVQHPRLPRREALKILPENVSADYEFRKRFEREADIAASLWHPHIVAVHDRGEHEGQLWITMDYVKGSDAAQLVRRRYPHGMPPREAIAIVSAVADALDYAHEQYLLHRDVKPANILIADRGKRDRRIVLADFGIAKGADETNGLTATNVAVGSVAYSAPEQLTGQVLDGRADQYALACTAFHLLTGESPFANSNPAVVIGHHLSSPAPELARLRPELASLGIALAKAMAKKPSHRFDSCRSFAKALDRGGLRLREAAEAVEAAEATQVAAPVSAATRLAPRPEPRPQPVKDSEHEPAKLIVEKSFSTSRRTAVVAAAAALLVVGTVAYIGARLAQDDPQPIASSASATQTTMQLSLPAAKTETQTQTQTQTQTVSAPPVTITRPVTPSPITTTTQTAPSRTRPTGDLGLRTPMSYPQCNGQGVVIIQSVTTPGLYASAVQEILDAHPGAYYLRTDQSCRSLRPATEEGNPIYAVFVPAGKTEGQVCAVVRATGGIAYGKWLNNTTDPGYVIPC